MSRNATIRCASRARDFAGFTLIELMVVVAIIIMAMGIMAPTLLEFFKNQKLKSVRAHFSSAFNVARLMAITEGANVRVVFFKEGVRVYSAKTKAFRRGEEFNPESAPGAIRGIHFYLRFTIDKKSNSSLREYRDWEKDQPNLNLVPGSSPEAGQCDVEGLLAIEFLRDGSARWFGGDDVPTNLYNREDRPDADIIATQLGNPDALFIDVRNTGVTRTKFAPLPEGLLTELEES